MAAKAKAAGKTDVPNLKESVVEVHVHSGTKRKAELPPRPRKGKNVKKIRAVLLGTGSASGAGSASGEKGPESGLIELPEISVRKDISITLPYTIVNSIDGMDADHVVRTMVEFGSKALVLSRRVGSFPCLKMVDNKSYKINLQCCYNIFFLVNKGIKLFENQQVKFFCGNYWSIRNMTNS